MNDLQKAFLRGACITIFGFAVTGLLAAIFLTPDEPKDTSREPKDTSRFEVIAEYEECNVIRYTDPTTRWQYFLKCP